MDDFATFFLAPGFLIFMLIVSIKGCEPKKFNISAAEKVVEEYSSDVKFARNFTLPSMESNVDKLKDEIDKLVDEIDKLKESNDYEKVKRKQRMLNLLVENLADAKFKLAEFEDLITERYIKSQKYRSIIKMIKSGAKFAVIEDISGMSYLEVLDMINEELEGNRPLNIDLNRG
jgi:uncharacterized protein YerC